jgi:DivIVA domain-containing protein
VRDADIAGVRDVDFPIALRGYDRDAVDDYVREVNRIIAELQVSRSPQSAIRHALDQVSEETFGILERAHETADEITARSRVQADDRLQWAEREARDAIAAATERVHALDADAEKVWQERQRLLDDVMRISGALVALVEDAAVRFPAEPEAETTLLPDLPDLSPTAEDLPSPAAEDVPPPPPPVPPISDDAGEPDGGPPPPPPPAGTPGA